jgi:hypothetical protein
MAAVLLLTMQMLTEVGIAVLSSSCCLQAGKSKTDVAKRFLNGLHQDCFTIWQK